MLHALRVISEKSSKYLFIASAFVVGVFCWIAYFTLFKIDPMNQTTLNANPYGIYEMVNLLLLANIIVLIVCISVIVIQFHDKKPIFGSLFIIAMAVISVMYMYEWKQDLAATSLGTVYWDYFCDYISPADFSFPFIPILILNLKLTFVYYFNVGIFFASLSALRNKKMYITQILDIDPPSQTKTSNL